MSPFYRPAGRSACCPCFFTGPGLRYREADRWSCAMSFASALNDLRPTLPYYFALTRYGLLRLTKDRFEFHPNPAAPPIALEMARAVMEMGASSCTESYVMSRTLAEGPKVFAFDPLTCEALENFDLSVSTTDYLQPFASVVTEPPADYPRQRLVPFDEA